jgi:YidC/Oxa1 family membrane protein insertase
MEKRLLIAIVLSIAVLFTWQLVFVKKQPIAPVRDLPVEARQVPESAPQPVPEALQEQAEELTGRTESLPEAAGEPVSGEQEQKVRIDTPFYQAVWSTKGGVLTSWRLRQHTDDEGRDLELVSGAARELGRYPFAIRTDDPEFDRMLNDALYLPSRQSLELQGGETKELRLEYADERGNRIQKIITFRGEGYDIDLQVNLWKNGQRIEPYIVWGPQFGNLNPASQGSRIGSSPGISVLSGTKVWRHDERKYKPEENTYNFVTWASYDDQYFMALLIASSQNSSAVFSREQINEGLSYYYLNVNFVQKAYLGPKQYDLLSDLGYEAKRAIRFGLFGFITEILYAGLKGIYSAVPNWGWSIVLLTIIIKILFFPLTYQSTKSMSKMQDLQPKIKALRNKYKKAKQDPEQRRKLNEETMRLYKQHGVNPAGGCLPMLIQLPIFWGFFQLLRVALEFRHSPWILWIGDLSVKDPYYVIPVLMGVTQFISQKMTPTSGDTTQQRMMLIMPVIMTIFFISFPSGLVLYWLTNNVLQIGQQYIMNRFMHKKKKESHGKPRKK